ncbi:hypothetical protein BV22DRAFT_998338, partial [Leucogyrophana mollusca]
LARHWSDKHTATFMELKRILLSEPVLKGPRFDGTPFIVISDRSKDGFGAILAQRFTATGPSGKTVTTTH